MKVPAFVFVFTTAFVVPVLSEDVSDGLWKDNKFTEAQPWPGKVVSVAASWMGYFMYIVDLETESKCCAVGIELSGDITYRQIKGEDWKLIKMSLKEEPPEGLTLFTPGIEVGRFSWSIGPHTLGQRFGEMDLLHIAATRKAKQSAGKPATAADSKPEGEEKPKPGSDARSQ